MNELALDAPSFSLFGGGHGCRNRQCAVPTVIGNRLWRHTIHAFISIIGYVILFGALGFILGSLAAKMTMMLVEFRTPGDMAGMKKTH
ncbi:hypothetical protein VT06_06660 [Arsukibacterium sp. MJ3]|nr:hypothetical protein VT06_06660 [Arsukibacterium sp. MJ3]